MVKRSDEDIPSLMADMALLIPFDVSSGPERSCQPVVHAHGQASQKKSRSGPSPFYAHSEIPTLAAADTFPVQCPLHVQLNQDSPVDVTKERNRCVQC